MTLSRRKLIGFAAASLMLAACASVEANPETTLYLVRHAEKQAGDNPSLTAAGQARADALAETLAPAGLTRICSTDTARTLETASPTAQATGLPIEWYEGDDASLKAFAAELKTGGGTVLVVGHSNTTPKLVEYLGGEPGMPINEAGEYDRLYVLHIRGGKVDTELRRYGAPYQP